MTGMRANYPFLVADRDRHGVTRHYVRRHGRKIRIKEKPGTEAFLRAYNEALYALDPGPAETRDALKGAPTGSLGWLASCYFASTEFHGLDLILRERAVRSSRIVCASRASPARRTSCAIARSARCRPFTSGCSATERPESLAQRTIDASGCRQSSVGRSRTASCDQTRPEASRRMQYASDGFHTWTVDAVRQFEDRHPIGTKARLAFGLLLYLGVRRGDVVTLGASRSNKARCA